MTLGPEAQLNLNSGLQENTGHSSLRLNLSRFYKTLGIETKLANCSMLKGELFCYLIKLYNKHLNSMRQRPQNEMLVVAHVIPGFI